MFHHFDLHVHTPFSDGQQSIEMVLDVLIEHGIKVVGFADHIFPGAIYKSPKREGIYPQGMTNCHKSEVLDYRRGYFRILDKKYSKIDILVGGEIDINLNGSLLVPRGYSLNNFDYLMIAKHHTLPKQILPCKKWPYLDHFMWKHNPRLKLNTILWEKGLYNAFNRLRPDIFAHFQCGLPHFLNEERVKRFVMNAKKYDVAIELNDVPKRSPVAKRILQLGHEFDVRFSLGSDFHGFGQSRIIKDLNRSQEYYKLVEQYDLRLLDPYEFVRRRDAAERSEK